VVAKGAETEAQELGDLIKRKKGRKAMEFTIYNFHKIKQQIA